MDISNLEKGHFERTEKAANYLLGLVLAGKKRATSSSLWAYEIEGEAVPKLATDVLLHTGTEHPAASLKPQMYGSSHTLI